MYGWASWKDMYGWHPERVCMVDILKGYVWLTSWKGIYGCHPKGYMVAILKGSRIAVQNGHLGFPPQRSIYGYLPKWVLVSWKEYWFKRVQSHEQWSSKSTIPNRFKRILVLGYFKINFFIGFGKVLKCCVEKMLLQCLRIQWVLQGLSRSYPCKISKNYCVENQWPKQSVYLQRKLGDSIVLYIIWFQNDLFNNVVF